MKGVIPSYQNDMTDLAGSTALGEEIHAFFDVSIEPGTNRLLSEDYHFCRVWREMGNDVWCAPWMVAAHVGTYKFEGKLLAEPSASPVSDTSE
jgi:hypothetical protein